MGQAFDRDGNVLGEAYGETKREVFDKLNGAFKDAHEIRVRSLAERVAAERDSAPTAEMPRYRCHKEVWALKIAAVYRAGDKLPDGVSQVTAGGALLAPVDSRYTYISVDAAYLTKHTPQAGGYYVVYKDGYRSFSPADAFEEGYTRL